MSAVGSQLCELEEGRWREQVAAAQGKGGLRFAEMSKMAHGLKPVSTEELIRLFRRAGTRLSEWFFEGVEAAVEARRR